MESVEVVVIGSGFGGSIPALRLAEGGREVLVLEQGRRFTPRDLEQDWSFRAQSKLFVTYQSDDFRVFFRYGRGLGGGSLTYAAAMLRAPSEVFTYEDRDAYRVWPEAVDRSVLDPHYAAVEEMMSVSRISWADVPRAGAVFARLLDDMGLTCDRANYPMVDCLGCGFCMAGCPFGRKKHLGFNYIPQAESAGVEFRTRCRVDRVEKSGSGWVVHYTDRFDLSQTVACDMVLLAAGALETPAILLRSGLKDLHPQVGKNMNNNGDVALMWVLPEHYPDAHLYMGRNNAGMITYAFWEEHRITVHAGAGPPALFAALDVVADDGAPPQVPLGLEFKHFMRDHYPHRVVSALAIGLVDGEGEITVDSAGGLHFSLPMTEHLGAYIDRVAGVARDVATATGARLLRTGDGDSGFEHGDAHPLGTCRMGDDEDRAPCTAAGELRGYPNLFVTDGASIPGGTGVNPAHTIGANAERIAAWILENK